MEVGRGPEWLQQRFAQRHVVGLGWEGAGNTLTFVEISHPVVDGNDLVCDCKLIEGKMPELTRRVATNVAAPEAGRATMG